MEITTSVIEEKLTTLTILDLNITSLQNLSYKMKDYIKLYV